MKLSNFAYGTGSYETTPDQLLGLYPLGGGGLLEAYYRHYYELKQLLSMVPLSPKSKVLEIGCGNGRWAASLAPLVEKYTAVDSDIFCLEAMKRLLEKNNIRNVNICKSLAQDFVIEENFDVVYLSGVSQFLSDQELRKLLCSVSEKLHQAAWLVDRSTLAKNKRFSREEIDYNSTYRTKNELDLLANDSGLSYVQSTESYLPMYIGKMLQRLTMIDIYNVLLPFFRDKASLVCPVAKSLSRSMQIYDRLFVNKISKERKTWTHQFSIYTKS